MRKLINVSAFVLAMVLTGQAQNLRTPAPSSTQTIKQDFGLSSIQLSYSRPNMKGRKVYGDLVPFKKVWRTGANQATTLTFGDEVIIGGTRIPAGKYGLVSIPDAASWTLIITKQLDITNPNAYKQENDVVRVTVPVKALPLPVETFTMQFENITGNTCQLHIIWEKTLVALPIKTDIDGKIMAQIDQFMADSTNKPYFPAAMYYMDNGKDLNKALVWFTKAAEENPKAYYIWYPKAVCESKLGKKSDAIVSATKSLAMAKEGNNPDYVALNEKLLAKLKK